MVMGFVMIMPLIILPFVAVMVLFSAMMIVVSHVFIDSTIIPS